MGSKLIRLLCLAGKQRAQRCAKITPSDTFGVEHEAFDRDERIDHHDLERMQSGGLHIMRHADFADVFEDGKEGICRMRFFPNNNITDSLFFSSHKKTEVSGKRYTHSSKQLEKNLAR